MKKGDFAADWKKVICSLRGVALLAGSIVLTGCIFGPATFLAYRESDLKDATQAIQTARDDAHRAKGYSARGVAYSERARYSRVMKLIPNDEYERLFDLAIKDHNQAVALDPNAQVLLNRAQAYYDRGSLDLMENKTGKSWFDAAALDFEVAAQKDPKNPHGFDMLGLTYESNNQEDKAIRAYTQEMALDSFGKRRLATAYCDFGFQHSQQKDDVAAAAAFEKSIEFGTADDKSCPMEPFASLVTYYTNETHQYDKAWETVHRALKAQVLIAPELMARLVKESARTN